MRTTTATRMRIAMVLGCVMGVLAPTAFGQNRSITVNDLRRENDSLRQQIDQLAAQLEKSTKSVEDLEKRVQQLTKEIEQLRHDVAEQGSGSPGKRYTPPAESRGDQYAEIPDGMPYSSPDALLAEVQQDYARANEEKHWEAMQPARVRRAVADWARGAGRRFRSKTEWVVEVTETRELPSGIVLIGHVIDPDSGFAYGPSEIAAELSTVLARRYRESPDTTVWRMVCNVSAAPRMNAERETQGFFDVPAFIGPYAEFVTEVRVLSLAPSMVLGEVNNER